MPSHIHLSLLDVDECADVDPVLHACGENSICVNTEPGYNCTCVDGYELQTDGRTCLGTIH